MLTAALTIVAIFSHEELTGTLKNCVYETPNGEYVKTINAVELCPITLKVEI